MLPPSVSLRRPGLWLGLLTTLHTLSLVLLFEPWGAAFSSEPVKVQDWGLHFHHLRSVEAFWGEEHRLWGYDPFFMAGFAANTLQDLSIKLFEFGALLLAPLLGLVRSFKLAVLAAHGAVPVLCFASFRGFFPDEGESRQGALCAALLGAAWWWSAEPREMLFYGMVGFPFACVLGLFTLSVFARLTRSVARVSGLHLGWLALAALLVAAHAQAAVVLPLPGLILAVGAADVVARRRALLWGVLGVLAVLLANWPWLSVFWAHRENLNLVELGASLPLFASDDPLTFLKDYASTTSYWSFRTTAAGKVLRLLLLVGGVLGLVRLARAGRRVLAWALGAVVVSIFLLTYFGSFVPTLRGWQPLRFKVALDLFLLLPCAWLLGEALRAEAPRRWRRLAWAGVALAALGAGLTVVQTEADPRFRLRTTLKIPVEVLVDWMKTRAPEDGRLLFEESGDESHFQYNGAYLSSFLVAATGRQLIGGPLNELVDRQHFAELHSGRFLKRPIDSFTDGELRRAFELYNIGAAMVFDPDTVRRLEGLPDLFTLDRRLGPLSLFVGKGERSWFLEGKGRVKASFGRLELAEVEGETVVLKYHWISGLVAEPATVIESRQILDDPIPFIVLKNPPRELVLRLER